MRLLFVLLLTLEGAGTMRDADFLPGQMYRLADGSLCERSRFLRQSLAMTHQIYRSARCGSRLPPNALSNQADIATMQAWLGMRIFPRARYLRKARANRRTARPAQRSTRAGLQKGCKELPPLASGGVSMQHASERDAPFRSVPTLAINAFRMAS